MRRFLGMKEALPCSASFDEETGELRLVVHFDLRKKDRGMLASQVEELQVVIKSGKKEATLSVEDFPFEDVDASL